LKHPTAAYGPQLPRQSATFAAAFGGKADARQAEPRGS